MYHCVHRIKLHIYDLNTDFNIMYTQSVMQEKCGKFNVFSAHAKSKDLRAECKSHQKQPFILSTFRKNNA